MEEGVKLKKSIIVRINPYKKKFQPNKLIEDVQMAYHPMQDFFEIRVLYWKDKRDYFDNLKKRSLIFTTPDKIEADRTYELLKKMYYGK